MATMGTAIALAGLFTVFALGLALLFSSGGSRHGQ